jgi:hypothetical protein
MSKQVSTSAAEEKASAVDVDCASFCLGYVVGVGARGGDATKQARSFGSICCNLSIAVAKYGNSPSLLIEEYDKLLLLPASKGSLEIGATTFKEKFFGPFLERALRRDGSNPFKSAVAALVRNETTFKHQLQGIWKSKGETLRVYTRLLRNHYRSLGDPFWDKYSADWFEPYLCLPQLEVLRLLRVKQIPTLEEEATTTDDLDSSDSDGKDGAVHEIQAPSGWTSDGVDGAPRPIYLPRLSLAEYTEAT